jgi:membrane protein YqaA with SNARE-associated domain
MPLLRSLYDKTLSLSGRPAAPKWLGAIAFIESFFFPIPADVLFLPMALARPERAYRYAWIATLASCAGGAFGYALGMYGYDAVARPVLEAMGKAESLERYRVLLQSDIFVLWGLLLSSGLTHVPPIKVVTVLSGFSGVPFDVFLLSALVGRGARFFLLAWLLKRYGGAVKGFVERRLPVLALGAAAALALVYGLAKAM